MSTFSVAEQAIDLRALGLDEAPHVIGVQFGVDPVNTAEVLMAVSVEDGSHIILQFNRNGELQGHKLIAKPAEPAP